MAKDVGEPRLDELSDREIERLEARLFCAGGPPQSIPTRLVGRTSDTPCAPPRHALR